MRHSLVVLALSLVCFPPGAAAAQEVLVDSSIGMLPVHREMLERLAEPEARRLTVDAGLTVCWAEGSDPLIVQTFEEIRRGMSLFTFDDGDRWSRTATDGPGLGQGDPTTLTWGIVPDGTFINGFSGEPASASNLVAFLDGLYGAGPGGSNLALRPWFPLIESVFTRWSQVVGITYVYEPNDDGSSLAGLSGSLGTRADVRIGGHPVDGNSGILAYNFFPNNGDMVIDTGDSFFNTLTSNSRRLRNVMSHEHGHGIGLGHVCPTIGTKLMEPFVTTVFDGPQPDDILAGNRGYGDPREKPVENDTVADATALGAGTIGNTIFVSNPSIDDDADVDYFTFEAPPGAALTLRLVPGGGLYTSGPEVGSACGTVTTFNAAAQSDLALEFLAANGVTVLGAANAVPAGFTETLGVPTLPNGPGTYYVRVTGAASAAQLYLLQIIVAQANRPPVAACQDVTSCDPNVTAAQVDAGSSDPDNNPLARTLVPAGPYPPGATPVSLIVSDGTLADTCQATITIDCPLGPQLALSPPAVVFADAAYGDTACATVTIRNDGDEPMSIIAIDPCAEAGFLVDAAGTAASVAPGDSTVFTVCFTPLAASPDTCWLTVVTPDSTALLSVTVGTVTSVGESEGPPAARVRAGIAPNPFRASAQVQFALDADGPVRVEVFDVAGRRIRTLADGDVLPRGEHALAWDGRDERGETRGAGIYFVRVATPEQVVVVRAVRVR